MIYRYTVRDSAGQLVSRHRNLLGALDAIAALHAKADREQVASEAVELADWHIYDERHRRPVAEPLNELSEGLVEGTDDTGSIGLRLNRRERTRLREIAASVGAVARSGRIVGQGSVIRMIRGIASGELLVTRPKGRQPARATQTRMAQAGPSP